MTQAGLKKHRKCASIFIRTLQLVVLSISVQKKFFFFLNFEFELLGNLNCLGMHHVGSLFNHEEQKKVYSYMWYLLPCMQALFMMPLRQTAGNSIHGHVFGNFQMMILNKQYKKKNKKKLTEKLLCVCVFFNSLTLMLLGFSSCLSFGGKGDNCEWGASTICGSIQIKTKSHINYHSIHFPSV